MHSKKYKKNAQITRKNARNKTWYDGNREIIGIGTFEMVVNIYINTSSYYF